MAGGFWQTFNQNCAILEIASVILPFCRKIEGNFALQLWVAGFLLSQSHGRCFFVRFTSVFSGFACWTSLRKNTIPVKALITVSYEVADDYPDSNTAGELQARSHNVMNFSLSHVDSVTFSITWPPVRTTLAAISMKRRRKVLAYMPASIIPLPISLL